MEAAQEETVQQSKGNVTSLEVFQTSKRYKEITDTVAYHLAKDLLPLRTVEKSGYKNLIHVLDPLIFLFQIGQKKKNNQ